MDRQIARLIIGAQAASDGGKGIYDIRLVNDAFTEKQNDLGYSAKSALIRRAILRINQVGPKCGFRYYAYWDDDFDSSIVYFSFRVNGRRYQISFHDFSAFTEKQAFKEKSDRHNQHWDRKSSREAAIILKDYISGKTPDYVIGSVE